MIEQILSGTKPLWVVLTGAGISAESGIPTFRASDGLWEGHPVEEVATPEGYIDNPERVQTFYNERRRHLLKPNIQPNAAHQTLADWQDSEVSILVVTQNIDNLHERAGSQAVLHMHGELLRILCSHSGEKFDCHSDLSVESKCACCGQLGRLRPDIVWFGEMPYHLDLIETALQKCERFISIGTSGHVYPAAGFVAAAKHYGAYTVELNLEDSQMTSSFHESHLGPAAQLVPQYFADELG